VTRKAPNRARIARKGLDPEVQHVEPTKVLTHEQRELKAFLQEDRPRAPRQPKRPALGTVERLVLDAQSAVQMREQAERFEQSLVVIGRSLGLSWDRLGRELRVPGETLRRRHAGRV
jgi:hypothetical protein